MTEKDIIKKIKQLRQIKPRQDWVAFTKKELLGQEVGQASFVQTFFQRLPDLFFQYKPALAGLVVLLLIGIFAFAQSSLPGDLLYPVKRAAEKGQVFFVKQEEMPNYNLKIANKRLLELTEIVQKEEPLLYASEHRVVLEKEVEPVIKEFQARVVIAAQDLARMEATTSSDPVIIKKIVEETKKLEENKQKVEKLGVKLGETKELDQTLALMVDREIKDLEANVLTEEGEQTLEQVKQAYEQGRYSEALEKLLLLSYPQALR